MFLSNFAPMKKWILVFCLGFISFFSFAQKTKVNTLVIDSLKAKWGRIKIVDGATMISSDDIIENMAKSKEYTVLITAIENAGLTQTFKSKGPITIFAPTNQAFNKLPPGTLDSLLLPVHKFDLSYLLTYHAIAGKLSARDIARKINANNGQASFITIAGSKLTAKIDENRNIVLIDENGGESVISKFDIPQSNGVLHVVSAVLTPKTKSI